MSRLMDRRLSTSRSRGRMPLGFRLWFDFVLTIILAIWGATIFGLHSVATDPDGTGRFIGRIVGGAISGAREGR